MVAGRLVDVRPRCFHHEKVATQEARSCLFHCDNGGRKNESKVYTDLQLTSSFCARMASMAASANCLSFAGSSTNDGLATFCTVQTNTPSYCILPTDGPVQTWWRNCRVSDLQPRATEFNSRSGHQSP